MNTGEIEHINSRYHEQDCYFTDDNKIGLRIKTGKDIDGVVVVYNDPYYRDDIDGNFVWPFFKTEMKRTGVTESSYYFTAQIPCEAHKLKYYFLLYSNNEEIQYSSMGFTKNYSNDDLIMFSTEYNKISVPPEWVKNTVWYEILPARFASTETNQSKCTLNGIKSRLPYLKEMGINGLYLNPVYQGTSYDKHDVINYEIIDSHFGTNADFIRLCRKAHEFDMKIMLDIPIAHCSSENIFWQDVLKKKKKSQYFSWFKIYKNSNGELNYETSEKYMPRFDTENAEVIEYFCSSVVQFWMENAGIDAFRISHADEISDAMITSIKQTILKCNKEAYLLGEVWNSASEWICSEKFDGVTNHDISKAICEFVCSNEHNILQYKYKINNIINKCTPHQLKCSVSLLDSYDTARLRNMCNNDKDKLKLSLLLLFTFYGAPSLYYGTERYMDEEESCESRKFVNWNDSCDDFREINEFVKMLVNLRRNHGALSNYGSFKWIEHNNLMMFERESSKEKLIIVINNKEWTVHESICCDSSKKFINIINGDLIYNEIEMNRLGFMVLKEKN